MIVPCCVKQMKLFIHWLAWYFIPLSRCLPFVILSLPISVLVAKDALDMKIGIIFIELTSSMKFGNSALTKQKCAYHRYL